MDGIKVIVVALVLFFVIYKKNSFNSGFCFWLIQIGLYLLLFSAILDFTDDIVRLNDVFILGRKTPWHDFLEDQIGNTLGFLLFSWGSLHEAIKK